jgi:hypothetical protein
MKLQNLVEKASDKNTFRDLNGFIGFCAEYLDYIEDNLQAIVVSQNENHYCFYQYDKSGNFQITRPVNSNLMLRTEDFKEASNEFIRILKNIRTIDPGNSTERLVINRTTYTLQQSIGAALDALPAGKSNNARKLSGDLFEHLVRLIIQKIGIDCKSRIENIPVLHSGDSKYSMKYQHDLIVENAGVIKLLGSIKTSSKDRIDKIFIDKYLYNKFTSSQTPHVAIFLNDVQRKNTRSENRYGINSTFKAGHFIGYTLGLNPLDGVYYCDIRPNMITESILKGHIKTFDNLLLEDIWRLIK